MAQPFRDFNLAGGQFPAILQLAAASDYRSPNAFAAADAEIQALDAALVAGPQLREGLDPSGLASSLISSMRRMPLSSAEGRDRVCSTDLRAGLSRRRFLEGGRAERCPPPMPGQIRAATEAVTHDPG